MSWIENLGQDARFGLRLLSKERWFTAACLFPARRAVLLTRWQCCVLTEQHPRSAGPEN